MDIYGLILLSVVSTAIMAFWKVLIIALSLAIQLIGFRVVVTCNQVIIAKFQQNSKVASLYSGDGSNGLLIGINFIGYIITGENYDTLYCVCRTKIAKLLFEITPEQRAEGCYMRTSITGARFGSISERLVMRSIPKGKVIKCWQSDILELAKIGSRAFLVSGPPNIGKSSVAGIIAHALGIPMIDNPSPEFWSISRVLSWVSNGRPVVILLDEIDYMLKRLKEKENTSLSGSI